ncbi:histidine phosphatase family protein [Paenibacillus turpanensis]|uniref:histidine phosphatase family protein n=1 Tax=Paenibacillus turpanensis TaxID=2689078 RepID=UPI0014098385|nr:histidine phosphatase family protein [Paenibacillus turpanensis]
MNKQEMTRIGFVRHGHTDWNGAGRLQGHRDIPLNENGKKQAQAIAARFTAGDWDLIVSSDLSRAKETAAKIAERLGISVVYEDERLRERHYGPLEGTTAEERLERWGITGFPEDPAYGVESNESLGERGWACVNDWSRNHPGKSILFVSHGGTIRMMFSILMGDPELRGPDNTSLSVIKRGPKGDVILLYNCISHLD